MALANDNSWYLEWTGLADPANGLWGDPLNWKDMDTGSSPSSPPEPGDYVWIANGDTVEVQDQGQCFWLILGEDYLGNKGSATLHVRAGLALGDPAGSGSGGVDVGGQGTATVRQTGGAIAAYGAVAIGGGTGGHGTYYLSSDSGPSSLECWFAPISLGGGGTAQFWHSGGSVAAENAMWIGTDRGVGGL
jgi:hypothetical protein